MRDTSSSTPPARRIASLLAALLASAVLLPLLGHRPLTNWDEGIYAEVSREMFTSGHWLVPYWNLAPWFEKPPLTLWLTAIFFKLFGVSAFTARLTSALSGVWLVTLLHAWLQRCRSGLTAWLSTLILLACFGFQHAAGVGEMDVPLALCCAIALIGLTRIQVRDEVNSGWLLFWLGFALAVMTKSAAAIVLPLTLLLTALIGRWPWRLFNRASALGLVMFLAIALPWHVALYLGYGHTFLLEYFGYHVIARATQSIENHPTHWWFYLWVVLVSAAPFALVFPVALYRAVRCRDLQPWAIFAFVVLVFFSLLRTRLPHYIVPLYPALAVVSACWLTPRLRLSLAEARHPLRFRMLLGLASIALYGVSAALTAPARSRLHAAQNPVSGAVLKANDRELIQLLPSSFQRGATAGGPLLLWRDGPPDSIATAIFYSGRPVIPIGPETIPPSDPRYNRYLNAYQALPDTLDHGRRLIVMNRSLLSSLPPGVTVTTRSESANWIVGIVSKVP